MNRLYYGDCLTIMQEMPLASIDLIYLDPPFNSNREYNAIYKDETGRPLPDQIEAFCDLWKLDAERERAIRQMPLLMREAGIEDGVAEFWRLWMSALRETQPRLIAYLSYMAQRLLPMRGLLKSTGSIYLHCDPTASHYVKALMDAIFGHENFRNEIIWKRTTTHSDSGTWSRVSDTILYFTKSRDFTWNEPIAPHSDDYIREKYRHQDGDGRPYMLDNMTSPNPRPNMMYEWKGFPYPAKGWRYSQKTMARLDAEGRIWYPTLRDGSYDTSRRPRLKRYLDETKGGAMGNIWTDIAPINSQARERLGYATQKPLALLERIIAASSNPGDVVFDPFCGCATTLEAAERLNRQWIGIDIAIHAVKRVAKVRLQERLRLAEGTHFVIEGVPRNVEGARDLWERDKFHFQKWAVEQVDGFVTTKRAADGGVDGRLYFARPGFRAFRSMLIAVKGGTNVGIGVVRDLRGVLERSEADMAGLIVMHEPGVRKRESFAQEMAAAGDIDVLGTLYPRMQLLTVEEILDGGRFLTPGAVGRGTGQQALAL